VDTGKPWDTAWEAVHCGQLAVNPLSLSFEGSDPSIWGTGVKRAIHKDLSYK